MLICDSAFENSISEADGHGLSIFDGVWHLPVLRLRQEEGEHSGREGRDTKDDDGKGRVDHLRGKKCVHFQRGCREFPSTW